MVYILMFLRVHVYGLCACFISQLVFSYNKLHACVGAGHEGGMAYKELSTLPGVH